MEKKSAPDSLNKTDYKKILRDAIYFSLVPITFYIGQVLVDIQTPGHLLMLKDFIPSNTTLIAIVGWAGNQILNTIRKYKE